MLEFETTHLKSMAGTGVAGVLAEEAAFLNPASLAFFNNLTVHAQRDSVKIKDSQGNVVQKPTSMGFVVADGNPNLSGSLSYVNQEDQFTERKRWGFSASSLLNEKSSFGTSIRKTKDTNKVTRATGDYYQTVVGVTHVLDEKTSMGIVGYDIFNSKGDATKAYLGIQHLFLEYITASADLGADYTDDEIAGTILYRGALQVRVLNDFYIRFGTFRDKQREEKGSGMGLSWIQPRLAFEFALKNVTQLASTKFARAESKNKETSFGISMRF